MVEINQVVDPGLSTDDQVISDHQLQLTDLETVLKDDKIQIVIVASPTGNHHEHITQALNAGKHVLAEKPLGKSLEEIQQCFDLAEQNSLTLHLGFQRRLDHNFQTLKNKLYQIGEVRIIKTSSRDNPRPSIDYLKISGNIFHDMLIHDFDMLTYLMGPQIPTTVFAVGHAYDPEIERIPDLDTVMVNLQYPTGLVCSIDTSRISAYGYDQRIEVFGTMGMAIAENERDSSIQLYTSEGQQSGKVQHSFPQRYRDAYLREMIRFIEGIRTGVPYTVTRKECILSHLIANAAHRSVQEGVPVRFADEYGYLIPD